MYVRAAAFTWTTAGVPTGTSPSRSVRGPGAHVKALVEDHGTGRCLFRVRLQVRPRPAAATIVLLAIGAIATGVWFGLSAGAIASAALAAGLLRQ